MNLENLKTIDNPTSTSSKYNNYHYYANSSVGQLLRQPMTEAQPTPKSSLIHNQAAEILQKRKIKQGIAAVPTTNSRHPNNKLFDQALLRYSTNTQPPFSTRTTIDKNGIGTTLPNSPFDENLRKNGQSRKSRQVHIDGPASSRQSQPRQDSLVTKSNPGKQRSSRNKVVRRRSSQENTMKREKNKKLMLQSQMSTGPEVMVELNDNVYEQPLRNQSALGSIHINNPQTHKTSINTLPISLDQGTSS